jgi:hypothetical protein
VDDVKLVGRQGAGSESTVSQPLSRCLTFVVFPGETAGVGLSILQYHTDRLHLSNGVHIFIFRKLNLFVLYRIVLVGCALTALAGPGVNGLMVAS